MSVTITYFVHGTSKDNEDKLSSGWKDVELSELGIAQAKELGQVTREQHFDVVIASDLERAYETAVLAFGDRCPIKTDPRLRECNYGDYNGKVSSIVEPMQEEAIIEPMPNGESYEDVKARIADLLSDLKRDYDGKHVAFVAHKAPQLALDVIVKDMSWEDAFANDWRKTKSWQPGWPYTIEGQGLVSIDKRASNDARYACWF